MDIVLSRFNAIKDSIFGSTVNASKCSMPSFCGLQKDEYKNNLNNKDINIYTKDIKKKLATLGIPQHDAEIYINEQRNLKLYYKAVNNLEESYKKESVYLSNDEWMDVLDLVTSDNLTKFSKENLEKVRNIDFSAFSMKNELTPKTDMVFFFESPELLENLLKAMKPYEKILEFSDLTEIDNNCAKYIVKTANNTNLNEISIDDYMRMALITGDITAPYLILNNLDKEGKYDKYNYRIKEIFHRKNPDSFNEKFYTRAELAEKLSTLDIEQDCVDYLSNRDDISPTEVVKALDAMITVMDKEGLKAKDWIQPFISSDFYSHYTQSNLEALTNTDFSAYNQDLSIWHKLHLLEVSQKPERLEKFLKTISSGISNHDIASIYSLTSETVDFVLETAKDSKKHPDKIKKFFNLVNIFEGDMNHAHMFIERGPVKEDIKLYDSINSALYGEETSEKKNALKKFHKETGIKLYMDNNLPLTNLEYLRKFVNQTKAAGEKTAPKIYITNMLDRNTNGEYQSKNYILSRPIVDEKGKINEVYFSTLHHENGHYLDYQNTKGKFSKLKLKDEEIISKYLGINAIRNRNEFIADMKKAFWQGTFQKHQDEQGKIIYRYSSAQSISEPEKLKIKTELLSILSQYKELHGPPIPTFSLEESCNDKTTANSDFDIIEIEEGEIV